MALYKLTYEFDTSGGNIEYQTTQQVQKEAETHDSEIALVTTGLALENETLNGTAIIEVSDDTSPAGIFESAEAIHQVSPPGDSISVEAGYESADTPVPEDAISAFEQSDELADRIVAVSETPGQGFLLQSDLTLYRPHERDLWLVVLSTVEFGAATDLTKPDIVRFYRIRSSLVEKYHAIC